MHTDVNDPVTEILERKHIGGVVYEEEACYKK